MNYTNNPHVNNIILTNAWIYIRITLASKQPNNDFNFNLNYYTSITIIEFMTTTTKIPHNISSFLNIQNSPFSATTSTFKFQNFHPFLHTTTTHKHARYNWFITLPTQHTPHGHNTYTHGFTSTPIFSWISFISTLHNIHKPFITCKRED